VIIGSKVQHLTLALSGTACGFVDFDSCIYSRRAAAGWVAATTLLEVLTMRHQSSFFALEELGIFVIRVGCNGSY